MDLWHFPGGGLPWWSPSNQYRGYGFDPLSGSWDSTCLAVKKPNYKNRHDIVINSIKTLKMVHIKNIFLKKELWMFIYCYKNILITRLHVSYGLILTYLYIYIHTYSHSHHVQRLTHTTYVWLCIQGMWKTVRVCVIERWGVKNQK